MIAFSIPAGGGNRAVQTLADWNKPLSEVARRLPLAAFALASLIAGPSSAGPVEDGVAAYQKRDYAAAVALLGPEANRGDPTAEAVLGALYFNGEGVPHDYGQAFYWYLKAASQGVPAAENQVGLMYCQGLGVAQDFAQAIGWYQKAADQNDPTAEENLALMYSAGEGAPQNDSVATHWFAAAAAQGDSDAEYNLGLMYDSGLGIAQDHAQAVDWWRKAAERGQPGAQDSLGAAYALGKGVVRDDVQAYLWFTLAATHFPPSDDLDRQGALRNRQVVAKSMTAAQIAQAEQLAGQWLVKPETAASAARSPIDVELNRPGPKAPAR